MHTDKARPGKAGARDDDSRREGAREAVTTRPTRMHADLHPEFSDKLVLMTLHINLQCVQCNLIGIRHFRCLRPGAAGS